MLCTYTVALDVRIPMHQISTCTADKTARAFIHTSAWRQWNHILLISSRLQKGCMQDLLQLTSVITTYIAHMYKGRACSCQSKLKEYCFSNPKDTSEVIELSCVLTWPTWCTIPATQKAQANIKQTSMLFLLICFDDII